jgi:hypothetical protein
MIKLRVSTVFLISFLVVLSALAAQASLSGRVFDADSGRGIPSLTIRLEAPGGGGQIVTYTDADGRFALSKLSAGRYLLTVLQGSTLLHREVVDINGKTIKDIGLRRR